jgi:hypothetical protein
MAPSHEFVMADSARELIDSLHGIGRANHFRIASNRPTAKGKLGSPETRRRKPERVVLFHGIPPAARDEAAAKY